MSDEIVDRNQEEAVKKNDTGPAVLEGDERESRAAYLKDVEKAKPLMEPFGYTDFEAFIRMVGSNAIFARKVIRFALKMDDKPAVGTVGAPQENNVVGTIDHSTFPGTLTESLGTKDEANSSGS